MAESAHHESLSAQADHVIEEARMVLPGVQALFGFQLIAVFNQRFESLSEIEQRIHFAALFAVAVAIALIMTPAIYHRVVEPERVTTAFIRVTSRCLTATASPLLIGLALDFYLVARLVTGSMPMSIGFTVLLVAVFVALWFVFPWSQRARRAR
jgi:cytochrome b561